MPSANQKIENLLCQSISEDERVHIKAETIRATDKFQIASIISSSLQIIPTNISV